MRQQDYWMPAAILGKGCIRRRRPDLEQHAVRWTDDNGRFDGIAGGRIPDRDPKLGPVLCVPQARGWFGRHPMGFADRRATRLPRHRDGERTEQPETKDEPAFHIAILHRRRD